MFSHGYGACLVSVRIFTPKTCRSIVSFIFYFLVTNVYGVIIYNYDYLLIYKFSAKEKTIDEPNRSSA